MQNQVLASDFVFSLRWKSEPMVILDKIINRLHNLLGNTCMTFLTKKLSYQVK